MTPDGVPVAESVVRLAASGDRQAQEQLLLSLHGHVRRTLYRLLLGRLQDLDDLTQTAMLTVLTSLASYRHQAALTTWVTGVCVNVVRDHLKSTRRRRWFEAFTTAKDEAVALERADGRQDPEHQLESRRALGDCVAVLETLSPNHRIAFLLRTVEERSIDEIATIMGSAKSTAKMRLYYARKAFEKALKRQPGAQASWFSEHYVGSSGGEQP